MNELGLTQDAYTGVWYTANRRLGRESGYKMFHYTRQYQNGRPQDDLVYAQNRTDANKLIDSWNRTPGNKDYKYQLIAEYATPEDN